jgi:hypothetical protein
MSRAMGGFTRLGAALALAACSFAAAAAGEFGTLDEATALVKKAVAYADRNGAPKAFEEFSKSPGPFVDRDLQDAGIFNPVTKKVEPKKVYWERHGDLIFISGAYAK